MRPSAALLLALSLVAACGGGPPARQASVRIAADAPAAVVSERFLSVAVDTAQVVGGRFWDPAGTPGVTGTAQVAPYDFDRPRLRALAAALAPAYLRIGGTDADRAYYDLAEPPGGELPAGYEWRLTRAQWDGVNRFASDLGYEVVLTLNGGPGPRDADRRWQPDNARALLEHAASQGHPVALVELGNEPNAFPLIFGFNLRAADAAIDAEAAATLVREVLPGARFGGPASAYWPVAGEINAFLPDYLAAAGPQLDVVTWHYYPQQSVRCPVATRRAGPEVMLAEASLDEVGAWAAEVEGARDAHAAAAEVWLGETGNAQCGGEPGVSDAFAGSFWWLDQLGTLARRGQRVVVRQTLSGSNYGLIDDASLEPNPDYWASLLWRRLMGPTVLDARLASGERLRAYAHCAAAGAPGRAAGAVTILLLNLDGRTAVEVALEGIGGDEVQVHLLTAAGLDAREVRLNGATLAAPDGVPPALAPAPSRARASLRLPPHGIAFVVAPGAAVAACQ